MTKKRTGEAANGVGYENIGFKRCHYSAATFNKPFTMSADLVNLYEIDLISISMFVRTIIRSATVGTIFVSG